MDRIENYWHLYIFNKTITQFLKENYKIWYYCVFVFIYLTEVLFYWQRREQQNTLHMAGVPGFDVTDDAVRIQVQIRLCDFIIRLSLIDV